MTTLPDRGVVAFLFADLDDETLYLIVEHPFLYGEGRLGDDDIVFEGIHLQVGDRQDVVVEVEGDERDEEGHEEEGAEEAEQGDARGFDGYQLVGLARGCPAS